MPGTKNITCPKKAVFDCFLAEAGFLKGQTKLEWHLGKVGPQKFESLIMKQFFSL